jgi:hypothetical protein
MYKFNYFNLKLSPCSECSITLFWVIPRRINFMRRRFGTLFFLYTQLHKFCVQEERTAYTACEEGTDRVFRNVDT